MDRPYRVTWNAGAIVVHAPEEKRAVDIMVEYLRQAGTNRIIVEPNQEHRLEEK
jgi:hypothetical protein